eukprot:scaffold5150_cov376-Prasinococcus_capsulatus_cf.AAC.3
MLRMCVLVARTLAPGAQAERGLRSRQLRHISRTGKCKLAGRRCAGRYDGLRLGFEKPKARHSTSSS